MTRIVVNLPNRPDITDTVFAPEAVAGLVGQKPKINVLGDHLGVAEVVAAEEVDGMIRLTLDVAGPVADRYGQSRTGGWSIGYEINPSPPQPPVTVFALHPLDDPQEIRMTRPHEQRQGPPQPIGDPQPPPLEDQPRQDEVLLERATEVVPEEPVEAVLDAVLDTAPSAVDWQVEPGVDPHESPDTQRARDLLGGRNGPSLGGYGHPDTAEDAVALAQVHAILALVDAVERLRETVEAR